MNFEFAVHELLSVGMIIVLGLIGGKAASLAGVPKVTGYLAIGLLIGPSVLDILSREMIDGITLINDIALGLIMFAIGGVFEVHHIRTVGKRVVMISVVHGLVTMALVTAVCWALGIAFNVALILGAIGMTTAPAATLLVLREYESSGELTDTIMTLLGVTTIMCIMAFEFAFSLTHIQKGADVIQALARPFYDLGGSLIIGTVVGALLSWGEQWMSDQAEMLLIIIASVLLATGLAKTFNISPLFTTLVVGAMTTNLSMMHRLLYVELRQTEQPLYIAFFVLSGANLHLDYLPEIGLAGIGYMASRAIGKYVGARWAAKKQGLRLVMQRYLGMAILCQGSLAIGLARVVSASYADVGMVVSTVILSSVMVFETAGPLLVKIALRKTGEIPAAS